MQGILIGSVKNRACKRNRRWVQGRRIGNKVWGQDTMEMETRGGRSRSWSWVLLWVDDVRAMERSLGKSRNNKHLYFLELLCQHWRLEYKVGMGLCVALVFMGRQCQWLEDLTSCRILSACIPWCCCAWHRMEGRHRLICGVGYGRRLFA